MPPESSTARSRKMVVKIGEEEVSSIFAVLAELVGYHQESG